METCTQYCRTAQFLPPGNSYKRLLLLLLAAFVIYAKGKAQLALDLEGGAAAFGYNDVRISGREGTPFSLTNDLKPQTVPYYRARVLYTIARRHTLIGLYAPLTIQSAGTPGRDVYFEGQTFTAGQQLTSTWKFNSYRLSYQYAFVMNRRLTLAAGITGKVRDAKIALQSGDTYACLFSA